MLCRTSLLSIKNYFRSIHTSSALLKLQQNRKRTAGPTGNANTRREAMLIQREADARAKWLALTAVEAKVEHKLPPKLISEIFTEHDEGVSVYFAENYAIKKWRLTEALDAIRDAADPAMFDCMDNPIKAMFTLNMRTKKSTKFIKQLASHVILPHPLNFLPEQRILALCKDAAEAEACLAGGAALAGCEELAIRMTTGAVHSEEFDEVVCHTEAVPLLKRLRGLLGTRLPTQKNGRIGDNTVDLVSRFKTSVIIESAPVLGVREINTLDVVIGKLSWDAMQLAENIITYKNNIEEATSTRVQGDAVSRIELYCPPVDERFRLNIANLAEVIASSPPDTLDENSGQPIADRLSSS